MSTSRLAFLLLLGAAASLSACNSTPADTATNADVVVRQDSTQRDSVGMMPAAVPSTEYTAPNTVVTESADSLHMK